MIPIGIINTDATLLDSTQVAENIKLKGQGKKADPQRYETVFILAASVLQEDVYQANVKFHLSPALHFSNNDNPITGLEIDFQDGKGFQAYGLNERNIDYTYASIGMHGLSIKLRTQRGIYVFQSQINVHMLTEPTYFREINLSTKPVKNGRTAAGLTGGTARVVTGCDNVFDRPVIIVEGFDAQNVNTIGNWLYPHYISSGVFTQLLNYGYDIVFLDFTDGGDYIQNNAQVLISLINEVNRLKSGNSKSIVIGESMGGLVARYALTEMERQGVTHNVSHYISFDSPHQGANVPIGIQTVALDLQNNLNIPLNNVFNDILPDNLLDVLLSSNRPAAKQMLSRYFGPNPDPEFTSFQAELASRGYPHQNGIRNLALINSSLDQNSCAPGYNPGDQIIDLHYPWNAIQLYNVKVWTNPIGFGMVSSISVSFGPGTNRYANTSFNYDLPPGSYAPEFDPAEVKTSFNFGFVPSYSAIDYRGPLNNNNDFYISARNARANGYTPFDAVYGDNINSKHVNVGAESDAWRNLFSNEFGVPFNGSNCAAQTSQAPPPLPTFSIPRLCADGTQEANISTNPGLDGLFDFTWTVQPGNINVNGPSLHVSLNMLASGAATITCTARSRQNPTVTSSYSETIRPCQDGYICAYQEGQFVYINASGTSYYAHVYNSTLYTTTSGGQFVSRSALQANGVPGTVASCFAETDPRGATPSAPGNYEGFLDGADCSNIGGWVYDRNNPNTVLNVDVLAGSTVVATGTAGNFRQDLLNAGKGNGVHGYVITTPASIKNGQNHTLSVRVANTGYILNNSYQTLNCPSTGGGGGGGGTTSNPTNGNYEGFIDYAGCETLSGWVYDQNSPNAHLNVDVLAGSTVVATGVAATYRQDLLVAGKGNGEHGYNISTPSALKNGQNQSVSIRVTGSNYLLNNSPQTINCAGNGGTIQPPTNTNPTGGSYEGFIDYADCGSIGGWVWNNSTPNGHLTIELLDGSTVVATGTAGNFRQDLLNAGKGNGEHGYGLTIPASLRNGQSHNLSIRVTGTNYLLNNSPRTISCASGGRLAAPEVTTGLMVYPNPTTDQVTLAFYLEEQETAQIKIVDVMGRTVYAAKVVGEGKTHYEPLSLQGQDAGVFVARVVSDKRTLSTKVVLTR